jgi:membrane metallo-endopeptidase-like protein 1
MSIINFYILGRQFDKHGNLKQWWNNRTIAAFRRAASCIVDQYSNYTLEEVNLPIDGRLTQGENIADNGGLKQAFRVCKSVQHLDYLDHLLLFCWHKSDTI